MNSESQEDGLGGGHWWNQKEILSPPLPLLFALWKQLGSPQAMKHYGFAHQTDLKDQMEFHNWMGQWAKRKKRHPSPKSWAEAGCELIPQQNSNSRARCVPMCRRKAGSSTVSDGTMCTGHWGGVCGFLGVQTASAAHMEEKNKWLVENSPLLPLSSTMIYEPLCSPVPVFSVKESS